jgi:hypothetical protein
MGFYETNSRAGPDRMLHLAVPEELAGMDLRITIEPANNGHGTNGHATNGAANPDPDARRRYLDRVLGTVDDPTFERPPQGPFERRDPLD